MSPKAHFRQIGARVLFFFPFQLVLLHLKKNHLTLLCWLVFFGYITPVSYTHLKLPMSDLV